MWTGLRVASFTRRRSGKKKAVRHTLADFLVEDPMTGVIDEEVVGLAEVRAPGGR